MSEPGINPHAPGVKLDRGKPPVFQGLFNYFPRAAMAVAEVSAFGANKYTWNGWEDVPDGYTRYSNALGRHLMYKTVEGPVDSESKLLHDAHIAWNALAALELYLREKEKNG